MGEAIRGMAKRKDRRTDRQIILLQCVKAAEARNKTVSRDTDICHTREKWKRRMLIICVLSLSLLCFFFLGGFTRWLQPLAPERLHLCFDEEDVRVARLGHVDHHAGHHVHHDRADLHAVLDHLGDAPVGNQQLPQ